MKLCSVTGIFLTWIFSFSLIPIEVSAVSQTPPPVKSPQLQGLEQFWINQYGSSSPVQLNITKTANKSLKSFPSTQATPIPPGPWATTNWSLLAKAQPDECYYGIGNSGNGPASAANLPACSGGIPKVNQAYIWGLAKSDKNVWFSTVANTHCLVMDSYIGINTPFENNSWVCEFGAQPATRDFRSPQVFSYDTETGILTDKTSLIVSPLLLTTVGIRSAGSIGNLVIFGGLDMISGINLFAFNNDTGAYIGAINLPGYSDIRKWLVVNNVLYTTVGTNGGGGRVLRWNGTVSNPFQYEEVGILDNEGAELAYHEGRIFVATWPDLSSGSSPFAGIFMGPPVPLGGLTSIHNVPYTKVWTADDYEPDPVVGRTYLGGALFSYQGDLYWGTMHIPFLATLAAVNTLDVDPGNDGAGPDDVLTTALGTHRAISIFRGHNLTSALPQVEILYGLQYMPVYDPVLQMYTFAPDAAHQNKMPDPIPKWGLAGFGNFFNAYTWSMAEYNNKLYIGTFDWSYLLAQGLIGIVLGPMVDPAYINQLYQLQDQINFPWYVWGADLYRINNRNGPAVPEDVAGLGNFTNYGIRNMIHGSGLFIGMANPMNLLTDPTDELPEGGWELISLEDPYGIPTLTEWGAIIFILLAGLGAAYSLRRQRRAKS